MTRGVVLPAPRTPGRYAVALVCLGNICRSPMAEVVLRDAVARAGLADRVHVSSCGTGPWHVGEPMDPRAAATLRAAGLDPSAHRGRQLDPGWFDRDLLLTMDAANRRDVLALDPPEPARVRMLRELDPRADPPADPGADPGTGPEGPGADVPDPYYGGDDGFGEVLAMVRRSCRTLVEALPDLLVAGAEDRA